MGCGISTLDAEDAPHNRRSKPPHHAIVPPPVVIDKKKDFENGDEVLLHGNNNNKKKKNGVMVMKPLGGDEEAKDEGSKGERLKEKNVVERKNKDEEKMFENGGREEHEDRHGSLVLGPSSPSFREYCNDYDCGDRSSVGDSNDSIESIKNGSGEDDSIRKNKPKNEENEKKERRGRGFRNVINKGRTRGRKNILNFACYNASNESYAEGSSSKIVGKTA